MSDREQRSPAYVIPRYRAAGDVTWYHVLHGNVPNHEIDFMVCPEVPQGGLTPTHFSHLSRLMKYIEPRAGAPHAFAIGNLSRDDTHHEAGHGALALIFGLRIGGATDHAGRRNPPFSHGIVAVDRELTAASLLSAAHAFRGRVMGAGEPVGPTASFYREYALAAQESRGRAAAVIERYLERYADLPWLRRSELSWGWEAGEREPPARVTIVHAGDAPFEAIARAAARLAGILYRSNIRWTSITSGRESAIAGGVSIRFASERELTVEDARGAMLGLDEVGEDEERLAWSLFGARPRASGARRYAGWRERFAFGGEAPEGGPAAAAAGAGAEPSAGEWASASVEVGPNGTWIMRHGHEVVPPAEAEAPARAVVPAGVEDDIEVDLALDLLEAGGAPRASEPAAGSSGVVATPGWQAGGAGHVEGAREQPPIGPRRVWLWAGLGAIAAMTAAVLVLALRGGGTPGPVEASVEASVEPARAADAAVGAEARTIGEGGGAPLAQEAPEGTGAPARKAADKTGSATRGPASGRGVRPWPEPTKEPPPKCDMFGSSLCP